MVLPTGYGYRYTIPAGASARSVSSMLFLSSVTVQGCRSLYSVLEGGLVIITQILGAYSCIGAPSFSVTVLLGSARLCYVHGSFCGLDITARDSCSGPSHVNQML